MATSNSACTPRPRAWMRGFKRAGFGLLLLVFGCAHGRSGSQPPEPAPRTVMAEPSDYEGVYVQDQQYLEPTAAQAAFTEAAAQGEPQFLGAETLSDGQQAQVVTYVHTYPEPIETFPRVYWSGRWYYNINGDFVYFCPAWERYGGWCSYWGPPGALVATWNVYFPWLPYWWGVGYYGPGWYWGGVGYYGYHAYGVSVYSDHHHHHQHHANNNPPSKGQPTGRPSKGMPGPGATPGEPTREAPRRKLPGEAPVARRTLPADSANAPPTRTPPGLQAPTRTGATRGTDGLAAAPARTPPQRTAAQRSYVNAQGSRVTVIQPPPGRRPASLGRVQNRTPTRTVTSSVVGRVPAWGPPVKAAEPARSPNASWSAASRSTPSRTTSSSAASPSRSAPARAPASSRSSARSRSSGRSSGSGRSSAPSRSFSPMPTRSAPSRSSGPSRSAPSRSHSSPSRSAPSRSAPSRSAPSRSAPSRSAPSRSAPSRGRPRR